MGIGAIIGTGIFVLVGTAAVGDADRPGAGPALVLSFIMSGAACMLAALCYAEFASMIPVAGSAYTYTYATMGELFAWITGWALVLEYGIACGAVAIGWSGSFVSILEPVGILGSLAICTLLYVAVAAVLTGIVPYPKIHVKAPVAEALNAVGYRWGSALVATGALAGITSVLIVMLLGQIRVFYAMSRDGLLSPWLSAVHPRYGTPHHATLVTGITVAILAGVVPIGVAAELTNIGTLFAFTLVCGAVLVLRRIRPELKRPFRTPFVPAVPVLGMAACLGIMSFLPAVTWVGFVGWMLFGLVLYFLYGFRHSRQATRHPA